MAKKKFAGRREHFGSLFYDFERRDYIPFDWEATYIFELLPDHTMDEIAEKIKHRVSRESFLTFVKLCQSIELINKDLKINGEILPHMPIKNQLSAPLRVHLQLTNQCELNCRHCSQDTRAPLPDELSIKEIKKLIDDMASIGTYEIVIGGGDPILKENEILEVVQYAAEKQMSIFISTTALFLGRVLAKKLASYPIKGFRVSFDGSTEKSFDYQRGKGAFRRVIRSIKTLRELFDCPITLHTVIMKTNYMETLSFIKAVQKLKCNTWSVDFVKSIGSARNNDKVLLCPGEIRETLRSIQRIQQYTSTPIELRHFPYQSRGKRIYSGFGCAGGNMNCWINAAGNVSPCSFLREKYPAGNIRENSLRDIWIYSANLELFRNLSTNNTCKECSYLGSCRGGCRARAGETGGPDEIDPACFINIQD